jgi:hypothetical protein
MPITILKPTAAPVISRVSNNDADEFLDTLDFEDDDEMEIDRPGGNQKHQQRLVTPGELVTDDSQFMRYVDSCSMAPTNCLQWSWCV